MQRRATSLDGTLAFLRAVHRIVTVNERWLNSRRRWEASCRAAGTAWDMDLNCLGCIGVRAF
jgi:hypothetical protein